MTTGEVTVQTNDAFRIVAAIGIPAAFLAIPMSAADCDEWNTRDYFSVATVQDVTACLQAGTAIGARDKDGNTPLHHAARRSRNPAIVQALLDAGADPKVRDNEGKTPWDYAKDRELLKSFDAYRRLNKE